MKFYKLILLTIVFFPSLVFSQVSEEAQRLYDESKYSEAKHLLEKDLEENPSNASVNFLLGKSALYSGDIKTAEKTLTLAKKQKVNDATLYLGRLYALVRCSGLVIFLMKD